MSAGDSPEESGFLEATPGGNDAFFVTVSHLVPSDTDTALDVYDARVCTSESPCLTPTPPPPPGCTGADACRPAGPPSEPPGAPPGSAGFTGPGSPLPSANLPSQGKLGEKTVKPAPKPLTRAQKLAKAIKACHKLKKKSKRHACEAQARRKYGAKGSKANHHPARKEHR